MDCIVPKAENGEREYNYLPTMVPSFSSFIEQKSDFAETPTPVPTYDAKGKLNLQKNRLISFCKTGSWSFQANRP